jgi:hypothetical protein
VGRLRGLLLLFVAAAAGHRSNPDGIGSIEGSISTQHTTPLAGVDVKIIDATGRIVASAMSDGEGRFRVANLAAGTYRLMAALDGFETTTESVVVTVTGPASITVDRRSPGSDTIDVVGTTTAVSGGNTLAPVEAIAPRARPVRPGAGFQGAIRLLDDVRLPDGTMSIKGGRPAQAGVQLGVTTLVDPPPHRAGALPDDAIESVTVLPNPYAVEYDGSRRGSSSFNPAAPGTGGNFG